MIGLRHLSNQRLELYASHFSLESLKPYLLDFYREAFATIVLYEDNIEVYHETGIFSFDASEPGTFNYEEFRAPLIEEFHDRLAICTVENLFLHFQRLMDEKPMEDDPFHNLVFSVSLVPPSRALLLDWEKNIDQRLRRVLYDDRSIEHFQLFPHEVLVVYSHDNYFTSVTSEQEDLLQALFEDLVEQSLAPITREKLQLPFLNQLYEYLNTYGTLRFKTERIHYDAENQPYLMVTFPGHSKGFKKLLAKIHLDNQGYPMSVSPVFSMPRWQYDLRYRDPTFMPMVLMVLMMLMMVLAGLYYRILFPSQPL